MTVYLIDENVLRELHSKGNCEVRSWYASVAQADLRISAMTFFEKRRGWECRRKSDPDLAATGRVHGFVLVTRNIDDMRGCDVKVLNPFPLNPIVETV